MSTADPPRKRGRPKSAPPVPPPDSSLVVVRADSARPVYWLCRCAACNRRRLFPVRRDKIATGLTVSCGCVRAARAGAELARIRWDKAIGEKIPESG